MTKKEGLDEIGRMGKAFQDNSLHQIVHPLTKKRH